VKKIPIFPLILLFGVISACTKKVESTDIVKLSYNDPTATRLFATNQNIYFDTYFTSPDDAIQLQSSNGSYNGSTTILKKSAGTTFQPLVVLPQINEAAQLTMANKNTGYFAGGSNDMSHLFKTVDGGNTWTDIYTAAYGIINISAPDDNNVFVNAYSAIYKSADGGKTWSAITATTLPNNNSGTDAVTLKDGRQLLVYNHVKPEELSSEGRGPRSPLNVAISKDGKSWKASIVLEDAAGEYSYPSVIQAKDSLVHIVYTWKRQRIKHVVIDPSKLESKLIINGKWPAEIKKVQ